MRHRHAISDEAWGPIQKVLPGTLEPFDALRNGFRVPQADPCGGRPVVPA